MAVHEPFVQAGRDRDLNGIGCNVRAIFSPRQQTQENPDCMATTSLFTLLYNKHKQVLSAQARERQQPKKA
jgi:hypothetical protein